MKQTQGAEEREGGREGGRGLFGLLSQAVRQERFCFLLRGHRAGLSWGSPRQNGERLLRAKQRGNRKVNSGKDGAREPTQHERQRKEPECLGMARWNTSAGR